MLIWQFVDHPTANSIAPHLKGGRFKIVGVGKARQPVLEYVSEWDSQEEASRFFTAYRSVLQKKWKRCDITADRNGVVAGTGDNGHFVSRQTGTIVTSVEGLNDDAEWTKVLNAFLG
jgi:hypothetical protein